MMVRPNKTEFGFQVSWLVSGGQQICTTTRAVTQMIVRGKLVKLRGQ